MTESTSFEKKNSLRNNYYNIKNNKSNQKPNCSYKFYVKQNQTN